MNTNDIYDEAFDEFMYDIVAAGLINDGIENENHSAMDLLAIAPFYYEEAIANQLPIPDLSYDDSDEGLSGLGSHLRDKIKSHMKKYDPKKVMMKTIVKPISVLSKSGGQKVEKLISKNKLLDPLTKPFTDPIKMAEGHAKKVEAEYHRGPVVKYFRNPSYGIKRTVVEPVNWVSKSHAKKLDKAIFKTKLAHPVVKPMEFWEKRPKAAMAVAGAFTGGAVWYYALAAGAVSAAAGDAAQRNKEREEKQLREITSAMIHEMEVMDDLRTPNIAIEATPEQVQAIADNPEFWQEAYDRAFDILTNDMGFDPEADATKMMAERTADGAIKDLMESAKTQQRQKTISTLAIPTILGFLLFS